MTRSVGSDDHISTHETAGVAMQSGLVAIERDGLDAGKVMNLDIDLSDGGAAFGLSVSAKNIAGGPWDVVHSVSLSYEETPLAPISG